jgi:hypothetical protein
MNRTARNLILVIGAVGVICLVSSTTVSTAQDNAHAAHKQHKTLTIALDATVVKVSLKALEQAGVNTAELSFGSTPPDKIASLLADKKLARVIGGVELTVADGQSGRVIMGKHEQVTASNGENAKLNFVVGEAKMELEAECSYEDRDIVAAKFSFNASMEEEVSSSVERKDNKTIASTDLDVNTVVYLHTGRPKIVAALKGKQDATILILRATIED